MQRGEREVWIELLETPESSVKDTFELPCFGAGFDLRPVFLGLLIEDTCFYVSQERDFQSMFELMVEVKEQSRTWIEAKVAFGALWTHMRKERFYT